MKERIAPPQSSSEWMFKTENPHGLILYDFGPSPCARRVRITLIEKGLSWDSEIIDLSRLEQRKPDYLKINPNGFVPTLAHGDRVIYESNVITEYLDNVFPEPRLYPTDPWELAQVKMWQSAEAAMAKDYRTLMYQRLMGPLVHLTRTLEETLAGARTSTSDPADLAWEERVWRLAVLTPEEETQYHDRLLTWLDLIEKHLRGTDYLVGKRFTQAEISVFPRVMMYAFIDLPITSSRFPNVVRWMECLRPRPSFATTLSEQDRGLLRLSGTPMLPWLRRTLHTPESKRSFFQQVGLLVARRAGRRLMSGAMATSNEVSARRRIRQPRPGEIPPANVERPRMKNPSAAELSQPITLYDYRDSPHGRRIRILLLEKGRHWNSVEVDMSRMVHKAPEYLAINPNGELPAIRQGERVLYDSQVIAEYLDARYAGAGVVQLYPSDAFLAAQVRMWLALEAGTHKEFRPLFYLYVVRPKLQAAGVCAEQLDTIIPRGVHTSHIDWLRDTLKGTPRFDTSEELARGIILKKVDYLNTKLASSEYLVGSVFTMADAAWFTRIDLFSALGIPLEQPRHGHVIRWRAQLRQRPSVEKSLEPVEAKV
jgi:glutathione S-transferase